MRKITVVCENQILLKHCNSAQYLSAASGTDYPWDLWASVISDKYQPGLVGFWFVFFFFFSHNPSTVEPRSVKSAPCPAKSRSRSAPVSR